MCQAVNHRHLNARVPLQCRKSSYKTCGGRSGTGTGFFSEYSWFIPTVLPPPPNVSWQPSALRLRNLTGLLPQSRDSSCYVSIRIRAPPSLWLLKHTDLRAHNFAHSPDLWHQPRLANINFAWSWILCGINTAALWFVPISFIPPMLHTHSSIADAI
jgi:hypothetical protein